MRLATKQVQIDMTCSWCRLCPETDVHVLFHCQIARDVWNEMGLQQFIVMTPYESVFDVVQRAFELGTREQCTLLGLMCWSIWNRRNLLVLERINTSVFGIKTAAMNMFSDWKIAQEQQFAAGDGRGVQLVVKKWEKPPDGWVKINVDAAIFADIESVGLGIVVRGSNGQFIAAKSCRREGLFPPREAEALALQNALLWLKEEGHKNCIFETDSQVLVRACKSATGSSYFYTIVRDCIDLFQHFDEVKVCFMYRSANQVAHALARAAYSFPGYREWHESAPEFLHDVICYDVS